MFAFCMHLVHIYNNPYLTFVFRRIPWEDSLMVPCYVAAASALIILVDLVSKLKPNRRIHDLLRPSRPTFDAESSVKDASAVRRVNIEQHRKRTIFTFKLARFLACLALSASTIRPLFTERTLPSRRGNDENISFVQCITYVRIVAKTSPDVVFIR